MKPKFIVIDYDTDESVELPALWEICDRCRGNGTHDHEAFSNGITSAEFAEDPDFAEDYMKGRYDVPCQECGGKGMVAQPELGSLSQKERELLECHYEVRREAMAERRLRDRGYQF